MSHRRIRPYKLFVGSFLPNWLMERSELSAGAKLCYARLAQHEGAAGVARPEQATLAAELGVGERQVRRYLDELQNAAKLDGAPLIEERRLGFGHANEYYFLAHPWMGLDGEEFPAQGMSGPERSYVSGLERTDVTAVERTDASGLSKRKEKNHLRDGAGAHAPTTQPPPRPPLALTGPVWKQGLREGPGDPPTDGLRAARAAAGLQQP